MGYELDAILAKRSDISNWKLNSALVYPLTDELGLIPMTADFWQEIKPLEHWAQQASKGTRVAHLTAEFFGGVGGHNCTLWVHGKSESQLDINEVLERFGIKGSSPHDAFDTVGLGRCRSNAAWAAQAVVDPINDSVAALIETLQYDCGDNQVQEKVRSVAASRLGQLKAVESLDALRQALNDAEYGTRLSAACALGEIGEPAVPILIGALDAEDPWGIVFGLGKVGRAGTSAVPHLVPLLRHADWRIRLEVIRTLTAIGSVGVEVKALRKDPEKLVRDAASEALKIHENH